MLIAKQKLVNSLSNLHRIDQYIVETVMPKEKPRDLDANSNCKKSDRVTPDRTFVDKNFLNQEIISGIIGRNFQK